MPAAENDHKVWDVGLPAEARECALRLRAQLARRAEEGGLDFGGASVGVALDVDCGADEGEVLAVEAS